MPFANKVDGRIWWLTVSKAADRSSKISIEYLESTLALIFLFKKSKYIFFQNRHVLLNTIKCLVIIIIINLNGFKMDMKFVSSIVFTKYV